MDVHPIRIVVVGTLNWVETAAQMCLAGGLEAVAYRINRYGQALRLLMSHEFRNCNAIYQVGAGGIKYLLVARLFGKPLIKHWIGTDAHNLAYLKNWKYGLYRILFKRWTTLHLADSPEVVSVLAKVGIEPPVVRLLPADLLGEVMQMPEHFTVLGYWYDEDIDRYGGRDILRLARDFPDVRFIVVGAGGSNVDAPKNVEFLGVVDDMKQVFKDTSAFVRLPSHDSISVLALEMLSRGRYVIYTHSLPGGIRVAGYEQAREALHKLKDVQIPNHEGARLVGKEYDPNLQAKKLGELIREHLLKKRLWKINC